MANENATIIIGSARLGSARQEHSAVFQRVNPFSALFAVFLNIFMSI